MTKSVMRVRGSLGVKFDSAESEKGSDVIETDSRATARVDPAETLIKVGLLLVAARVGATAPMEISARPTHRNDAGRLPKPEAQVFIGYALSVKDRYDLIEMRRANLE